MFESKKSFDPLRLEGQNQAPSLAREAGEVEGVKNLHSYRGKIYPRYTKGDTLKAVVTKIYYDYLPPAIVVLSAIGGSGNAIPEIQDSAGIEGLNFEETNCNQEEDEVCVAWRLRIPSDPRFGPEAILREVSDTIVTRITDQVTGEIKFFLYIWDYSPDPILLSACQEYKDFRGMTDSIQSGIHPLSTDTALAAVALRGVLKGPGVEWLKFTWVSSLDPIITLQGQANYGEYLAHLVWGDAVDTTLMATRRNGSDAPLTLALVLFGWNEVLHLSPSGEAVSQLIKETLITLEDARLHPTVGFGECEPPPHFFHYLQYKKAVALGY